jgi:peptide/nickel transport system substrate-binding protein
VRRHRHPARSRAVGFLHSTLGGVAGLAAWLQGWPKLTAAPAGKDGPSGQLTWAVRVTVAPTWFEPAETPGVATPFVFMYAMHDATVKPMPGNGMFPSLATRWTESPDGLSVGFELRRGVKFHNGDPFTAEDVQFSFAR